MSKNEIDWLLVGRYGLLIALTTLIPVPLLDRGVENVLRRRLVRAQAAQHGVELDEAAVATLANVPLGGCMGFLVVFAVKAVADMTSEVVHRALMLHEALELGFLPGDADRVRIGMDKTLVSVDTRVVERSIRGVFQDHTNDLNRVIAEATRVARKELSESKRESALADAIEADEMGSAAREMTTAMTAALRGTGTVPELISWFRTEMGAAPPEVAGVVEPEVLPADDAIRAALPAPVVEEATVVEEAEEVGGEE